MQKRIDVSGGHIAYARYVNAEPLPASHQEGARALDPGAFPGGAAHRCYGKTERRARSRAQRDDRK